MFRWLWSDPWEAANFWKNLKKDKKGRDKNTVSELHRDQMDRSWF